MPLTPDEQAELDALEAFDGGSGGGLTPEELQELQSLEALEGGQAPTAPLPVQSASLGVPASPEQPQSDEGSFLDALGSGLTLGNSDEIGGLIAGGGQGLANLLGIGDGQTIGEAYTERRDEKRADQAGFAERNPATSVGLEIAGGLATPGLGVAGQAAKGALSLGRAVGTGAAAGAAAGFGASEEEELGGLARDTLIGGALGGGTAGALSGAGGLISQGAQRFVGGPGVAKTGAKPNKYQKHVKVLDDAEIVISSGQRSGNKAQIASETTASETLLGSGLADTFDEQGTKVRSKLMSMAGFAENDVGDGIIDRATIQNAKDRFADRYGEAFQGKSVDLSKSFPEMLKDISSEHTALLPFEQKRRLAGVIEDFGALIEEEPITGEVYQRLRSRLGRLERSTKASDGVISDLYADLKVGLDDAFAEAAGLEAGTAEKAIDRDYRNFKVLEKASQSAGADVAGGEPTIRSIANKARNPTKGGTTDFRDLADAAQNITTDRTPNSGTASRLFGLTSGAVGQGTAKGIQAAQAVGIGTGTTPTQRAAGATLSTGLGPSIYNAIAGTQNLVPDDEEEERRRVLLEQFGQAQTQLTGGQQL